MSQIGSYITKDFLGSGQFGSVVSATKEGTDQIFAIKRISKESIARSSMTDQVKKEISIMKSLKHPYIVRTYDVLMSPKYVFICMENVTGGELHSKISQGKLDDYTSSRYTRQLCEALKYCHDQRICHRDIKPQNILLDGDNNVKLVDFGFASVMEYENIQSSYGRFDIQNHAMSSVETSRPTNLTLRSYSIRSKAMHTYCGTEQFMAPEISSRDEYYGDKVDMWAVGMVVHFMLLGRLPDQEKYDVRSVPRFLRRLNSLTPNAMNVLHMLLTVDPDKRGSAGDILASPWCQSENTDSSEEEIDAKGRMISDAFEDDCEEYTFNKTIPKEIYSPGTLMNHVRLILDDSNLKTRVKGDNIAFSMLTPGGVSILCMEVSESKSCICVNDINIYCMNKLKIMFKL